MLEGGAPCVLDAYLGYLRRFIVEQQLPDLFLFVPTEENGQSAMDRITLAKYSALTLIVADLLVEIEHVLRVVGAEGSVERLRQEWTEVCRCSRLGGPVSGPSCPDSSSG